MARKETVQTTEFTFIEKGSSVVEIMIVDINTNEDIHTYTVDRKAYFNGEYDIPELQQSSEDGSK